MMEIGKIVYRGTEGFRREGMTLKVRLMSAETADQNGLAYQVPICPKECREVIDMSCPHSHMLIAAITTISDGRPSTRYQVAYTSHTISAESAILALSKTRTRVWGQYYREILIRGVVEGGEV